MNVEGKLTNSALNETDGEKTAEKKTDENGEKRETAETNQDSSLINAKWKKGLLIGLGVGVAAPVAITGGLALAGFGAGGVVAGSVAAGIQSAIGNVAAGSLFASKLS